jgi:hypothetical protein
MPTMAPILGSIDTEATPNIKLIDRIDANCEIDSRDRGGEEIAL